MKKTLLIGCIMTMTILGACGKNDIAKTAGGAAEETIVAETIPEIKYAEDFATQSEVKASWKDYKSLEEALEDTKVNISIPEAVANYSLRQYRGTPDGIVEIIYFNEDGIEGARIRKGYGDIDTVYHEHPDMTGVQPVNVDNRDFMVAGNIVACDDGETTLVMKFTGYTPNEIALPLLIEQTK